jgi:hypothetical protein
MKMSLLAGLLLLTAACGGNETGDLGAAAVDTSAVVSEGTEAPAVPEDVPTEATAEVEPEADSTQQAARKVRVEEFQYSLLPGGARVLTGKLYNETDDPIRNAQIQVSLFDEANRRISSISILVHDSPPRDFRTFREAVDVDNEDLVSGARVRSVLVL